MILHSIRGPPCLAASPPVGAERRRRQVTLVDGRRRRPPLPAALSGLGTPSSPHHGLSSGAPLAWEHANVCFGSVGPACGAVTAALLPLRQSVLSLGANGKSRSVNPVGHLHLLCVEEERRQTFSWGQEHRFLDPPAAFSCTASTFLLLEDSVCGVFPSAASRCSRWCRLRPPDL